MNNHIKSFFLLVTALGILVLCGDRLYRLWRDENILQEQLTKQSEDTLKAEAAAIEKRKQMDQFYISQFELHIRRYLNNQQALFSERELNNNCASLENKMIQDGYTHAEAGLIFKTAALKIRQSNTH